MNRDLYHDVGVLAVEAGTWNYAKWSGTAAAVSTNYVDLQGYNAGALLTLNMNVGITSSDTTGKIYIPFVIQESDDHSTWTDAESISVVPYADTVTGMLVSNVGVAAATATVVTAQYIGKKRYVRLYAAAANVVVPTSSGSTSAIEYCLTAARYQPYQKGNAYSPFTNQL